MMFEEWFEKHRGKEPDPHRRQIWEEWAADKGAALAAWDAALAEAERVCRERDDQTMATTEAAACADAIRALRVDKEGT